MEWVSLHHHSTAGFAPLDSNSRDHQNTHVALRKSQGLASAHLCVMACGRMARDWAWIHGEDPYDFRSYSPACRLCHMEYDRPDWLKEERRKERERIESGRSFKGWSKDRREAQRNRMLEKWKSPAERQAASERCKQDAPWTGRRPKNSGGDAR